MASGSCPGGLQPIRRMRFTTEADLLAAMKTQAEDAVPLIVEATDVINVSAWSDLGHLCWLLRGKELLVKKSPNHRFRYFDLRKNIGKFEFKDPVEEVQMTLEEFLQQSKAILAEGRPERMYLQETLSGHSELAEEFATWRWELLIRVSSAFGWGLPDSNELFIGMEGAETPLHFDERENLFFQVRGEKELITYPFVEYTQLYPFPTTHPCDRQSMVGDPRHPDLEAFPRFAGATGYHATLKAGDLVYLPYGWWHWLLNVSPFAVSVSFWSTTPPSDLSKGVPTTFSKHMLTRVRRNLETMIAHEHGPGQHNESMLKIREAVVAKRHQDPRLDHVRRLLAAVKLPLEEQDSFLLEMIDGRFGIDWNQHV